MLASNFWPSGGVWPDWATLKMFLARNFLRILGQIFGPFWAIWNTKPFT